MAGVAMAEPEPRHGAKAWSDRIRARSGAGRGRLRCRLIALGQDEANESTAPLPHLPRQPQRDLRKGAQSEIDIGISGPIAHKVGESMRDLAQYHQIISITHLPQIAALGDVHFAVEKIVDAGRTKTQIRRLEDAERAEQVATLLSGTEVTEATLESARELMADRGW